MYIYLHIYNIHRFAIDGSTLLLFKKTDFMIIGIKPSIHIKKIFLALERIYPTKIRDLINVKYHIRIEKIRKHYMFDAAAKEIQRLFRGYIIRRDLKYTLITEKMKLIEEEREKEWKDSNNWYTDKLKILHNQHKDKLEKKEILKMKSFGRYKQHLSVNGFGQYEADGKWKQDDINNTNYNHYLQMTNPTKNIITEKLLKSGYDDKRIRSFKSRIDDKNNMLLKYK